MPAMRLNADVLLCVAQSWCGLLDFAKSPPIPVIRAEAMQAPCLVCCKGRFISIKDAQQPP